MIPIYIWPLFALALVAISSAGLVFQELGEVPPLLRASWRMQATSLVLLPLFLWQWQLLRKLQISLQDVLILLGSSVCLGMHFGFWVWSLDHTSLVHSLLFVTSHPLVIVTLMPILGQHLRKGHIWGTALGVLGALITLKDTEDSGTVTLIGDLVAIAGAVAVVGYFYAGHYLRSKRQWPIFVYALPVTMLAGVWLGLASWAGEESVGPFSSNWGWFDWWESDWIWAVAYLAVGPGLCGHTGLNTVMRYLPPVVVSVGMLLEPLLGGIIEWFWRGGTGPGFWTWLGAPLLIIGAGWVTLTNARSEETRE